VTLITHGLNGNVDGWVTGMADRIPNYSHFPGTNFSTYTLSFVPNGSGYLLTAARVSGSPPASTESGEIILKLDWSQLADGNSYDTYQVTAAVLPALLSTNFLPEFSGHAIAELPLHLIGHSRGGSLICELSKQLGTNGIWVDHLTTLDPHPLNNDGNSDPFFPTDAPASSAYVNVLFCDNYWQDFSGGFLDFNGEPVAGAYNRHLTSLSGGYESVTSVAVEHSNVHLWYHGTLDLVTADGGPSDLNTAAMIQTLQATMADDVGPFRTQANLTRARATIDELAAALGERPAGDGQPFDMRRIDWLDLRNALLVARIVTEAALKRTESRGAHQREDFPGMVPDWQVNQTARLSGGRLVLSSVPVAPVAAEVAAQ